MGAMSTSATGMTSSEDWIQVISNNVANAQTNAFKRSDVSFSDIYYQILKAAGASSAPETGTGISLGLGVQVSGTPLDFSFGPVVTGTTLDVRIEGEGFFRVVDADGNTFYTRLGSFLPKAEGSAGPLNLQLSRGTVTVEPAIVLPGVAGEITVDPDGTVWQGDTVAGRFELVQFRNEEGLLQEADVLFSIGINSGPEIVGYPEDSGFGSLEVGVLEGSNVDLANELILLTEAARMFNLSSQAFDAGNANLQTLIGLAQET